MKEREKERREEQLSCTELYVSFPIQLCENYRALIPSKQGVFWQMLLTKAVVKTAGYSLLT